MASSSSSRPSPPSTVAAARGRVVGKKKLLDKEVLRKVAEYVLENSALAGTLIPMWAWRSLANGRIVPLTPEWQKEAKAVRKTVVLQKRLLRRLGTVRQGPPTPERHKAKRRREAVQDVPPWLEEAKERPPWTRKVCAEPCSEEKWQEMVEEEDLPLVHLPAQQKKEKPKKKRTKW